MQTHLNPPTLLGRAFVRVFLAALVAALVATLAGCGSPDASDPGLDALSSKVDALGRTLADSGEQAEKLAFWQIAAAFLVVVSGFALVGGAALGSIARRETDGASEQPEPPTETTTKIKTDHDDDEILR